MPSFIFVEIMIVRLTRILAIQLRGYISQRIEMKIGPEKVTHRVIYDDQCHFREKANDEILFLEINE